MARIFLVGLFILISTSVFSQRKEKVKGDRNVTLRETPVNSFNRILVGEDFKVDLIYGETAEVEIETDDNLHDVIDFQVADSTLSFGTNKRVTTFKKMRIKVTYPSSLKQIETVENGEVSSLTSIEQPELTLSLNGNSRAYLNIRSDKLRFINANRSKAKLNVNCKIATLELNENSKTEALIVTDSMQVDLYQRADARIDGDVDKLEINADNSSNFDGKNLTANSCIVIAGLNSDVAVQVVDELQITADGSAEVYIYESPQIIINKLDGTSKIHKKEMKK